MENRYKIGEMYFSIVSESNGYGRAMWEYFSDKLTSEEGELDLSITIAEGGGKNLPFEPELYSLSGGIAFNSNAFYVKRNTFSYVVMDLFQPNVMTKIYLYPRQGKRLKRVVQGFLRSDVEKRNQYESFVRDVTNYGCLWYLFALALMKHDCVFLHSGILAKDGKGIVLTGTGGCGKTSTMLEAIASHNYQYVSEDFGILSKDGMLYDMQKKAAIYQSDVKWGNPILAKALSSLPFTMRLAWKWKKLCGRNSLHFFKPSEIFGENIAHESRLSGFYYLKRVRASQAEFREISVEEIAQRAQNAAFRELKEVFEILSNIRAVGGEEYWNYYPSLEELEKTYREILMQALENAAICGEISIPIKGKPADTVDFIVTECK